MFFSLDNASDILRSDCNMHGNQYIMIIIKKSINYIIKEKNKKVIAEKGKEKFTCVCGSICRNNR